MTGANATFGTSTDNGIKMALDEINGAGGVDGSKINLQSYDDQGASDQARSVVTRLVEQDHVGAVLGEVASSNSIAAAPVCQSNQVPMITPASTNPKVTQMGNYIFRTCFIDPFQGSVMATFAYNNLHLKTAAVFYDNSSDYSKGLQSFFVNKFQALGGKIVATTSYKAGDPDFKAQLDDIKSSGAQMIYVPGYYTDVGTIASQARQLQITVPLMGGDGWDSPKLFDSAGNALEGCYFSNHYSVQSTDPDVQKFVTAYEAKYSNQVPDAMAALAYDATHILANAYTAVGKPADGNFDSPDYRAKLRDAIAATKSYKGVTGVITIGPDRNAVKPAVVLQIKGKAYKFITTVAPS
jgi:branched-chain amino acid transport system substrate-binding protein